MADYNESTISGSSWQRTFRIVIENRYGESVQIGYSEEKILIVPDAPPVHQYLGDLVGLVDIAGTIDLRDPGTLELTGETIPVSAVYVALLSDYINRAKARDVTANAPAPIPELTIEAPV